MATDWTALRLEYVNGAMTLRELADKHSIKSAGVMTRSANEGWEDERKQRQAETSKLSQAKLTGDRAEQLAKFNEDDLRMARAIRAKAAQMMQTADTPHALSAIARSADVAQKIGRLALGVETDFTSVTTRELPASIDDFV